MTTGLYFSEKSSEIINSPMESVCLCFRHVFLPYGSNFPSCLAVVNRKKRGFKGLVPGHSAGARGCLGKKNTWAERGLGKQRQVPFLNLHSKWPLRGIINTGAFGRPSSLSEPLLQKPAEGGELGGQGNEVTSTNPRRRYQCRFLGVGSWAQASKHRFQWESVSGHQSAFPTHIKLVPTPCILCWLVSRLALHAHVVPLPSNCWTTLFFKKQPQTFHLVLPFPLVMSHFSNLVLTECSLSLLSLCCLLDLWQLSHLYHSKPTVPVNLGRCPLCRHHMAFPCLKDSPLSLFISKFPTLKFQHSATFVPFHGYVCMHVCVFWQTSLEEGCIYHGISPKCFTLNTYFI